MKINSCFFRLLAILFLFGSCNQDEGLGGSSAIEGYVYNVIHQDDNFSFHTDTFPALNKKVFINFGNDAGIGDDVDTGMDGYFRFNYLNEGQYTIFALSELANGEKKAEIQKIKAGGKLTHALPIYIHSGKAYGTAMIKGKVSATYHHNGNPILGGTAPGIGMHAYIRHLSEEAYFDDVRVANGIFVFQKILPGEYLIAIESEDSEEIVSFKYSKEIIIPKINGTEKEYIAVPEEGGSEFKVSVAV